MGRQLRQRHEDGWHHAYGQGVRKEFIFGDDKDRLKYLDLLEQAFDKRDVKLFAYCLVDNHYHLGVYDPNGEISEAMHELGSKYARYFNDRYGYVGPLFRSRFCSRPLLDDADLVGVSRYIHRNALDVNPTAPIEDYRWSSFRSYVGHSPTLGCLVMEPVLTLAGGVSAYQRLVAESAAPTGVHDGSLSRITIGDIEAEVRRVFGAEEEAALRGAGRGRTNDGRNCAAALTFDLGVLSQEAATERYGYRSRYACVDAVARFHRRLAKDPDLAGRYELVRTRIYMLGRSRAA